jgi:uncharacterized protein GlcG (DUF336 family)
MFNEISIGIDDAQLVVAAVMKAVGASDGPLAVAVTDGDGNLVHLVRQDGTSAVDVRNAERKAYTAAYIGRDTSLWRLQILHDGRTVADWSNDKTTTIPGGWTLRRQSQVIGGVGVSGSGNEDRDERLALAGAEAAAELSVAEWRTKRDPRLIRDR